MRKGESAKNIIPEMDMLICEKCDHENINFKIRKQNLQEKKSKQK